MRDGAVHCKQPRWRPVQGGPAAHYSRGVCLGVWGGAKWRADETKTRVAACLLPNGEACSVEHGPWHATVSCEIAQGKSVQSDGQWRTSTKSRASTVVHPRTPQPTPTHSYLPSRSLSPAYPVVTCPRPAPQPRPVSRSLPFRHLHLHLHLHLHRPHPSRLSSFLRPIPARLHSLHAFSIQTNHAPAPSERPTARVSSFTSP